MAQDDKRNRKGKPDTGANRSAAAPAKGAGGSVASRQAAPAKGASAGPAGKPVGRQSVAAARKSSDGSNRTQLIIGIIAIAVIAAIVIAGVVFTKRQAEVQADGYGASIKSVATAGADGVVAVSAPGSTPKVTIDVFEDALCPICGQFENQFGQQINQALDNGTLAVNYHMLNFLNPNSFSGTYSTRAAAALLCVAQDGGTQPGLYMGFHSTLFNPDNQPEESGTSDLSNDQLAALATSSGAPAAAAQCISSGQNETAAAASADSSKATLNTATGQVATPTVLVDGAPVKELAVDWLSNLLAQS